MDLKTKIFTSSVLFLALKYVIGEDIVGHDYIEHLEGYMVHDNFLTEINRHLYNRVNSSLHYGLKSSKISFGLYLTSTDLVQYYLMQLIHSLLNSDDTYTQIIIDSYSNIDINEYNLTRTIHSMTISDDDIFKAVKTLSKNNSSSLTNSMKVTLVALDNRYKYFYNACKMGDVDLINWALGLGVSLRMHGTRALEIAWTEHRTDAVRFIMVNKDFPYWKINNTHALLTNSRNETLLHILAETKSTTTAIQLIVSGANIDVLDDSGKSPLYRAVETNSTDMVNLLLIRQANAYIHLEPLNSLLYVAASKGYATIVRQLVENGMTNDTKFSVSNALEISELNAMEILMDHILTTCVDLSDNNVDLIVDWNKMKRKLVNKCNVYNTMCTKGYQSSRLKLLADYSKVITTLREAGFKSNVYNGVKHTLSNALMEAGLTEDIRFSMEIGLILKPLEMAIKSGDVGRVRNVVQAGADLNEEMEGGARAIHLAASLGHGHIIGYLLGQGVDVNSRTKNRKTPIYLAAEAGHLNASRTLIDARANVYLKANNGFNAVYAAVSNNRTDILKLFINSGVDFQRRFGRKNIYSPLEYASEKGLSHVVMLLHEIGVYMYDESLLHAIYFNRTDIIRYFLKNGIMHKRALMAAVEKNNTHLVKMLIESGADVNYSHIRKKPIHVAAQNGNVDILKMLLDNGADINKDYGIFGPPLSWAITSAKEEAVRYLLSRGAARPNNFSYIIRYVKPKRTQKRIVSFVNDYYKNSY